MFFQGTYKDDFHPMNTVQERIINMVRYLNVVRNHDGSSSVNRSKEKNRSQNYILAKEHNYIHDSVFLS